MRPHGIMFHHFHDNAHPRGQGAITAREFEAIIDHLGRDRILDANEWFARAVAGTLADNDICLTFDDALLCQYDVAVPVLDRRGIRAFFFVYSSVFEGGRETLEIYRYFRTVAFEAVDQFYDAFHSATERLHPGLYARALSGLDIDGYLADFPFYTREDRIFRYIRDNALPDGGYDAVMAALIAQAGFDTQEIASRLWMTNAHLLALKSQGHVIGLHSYSHPMTMGRLSAHAQAQEYGRNREHLLNLLGQAPLSMSHPCNSYNAATLDLLGTLGLQVGFRANMADMPQRSRFEFPRQDHANVLAEVQTA